MSEPEFSSELRQLILDRIDSVAQLEALLLCRANPKTEWTAETVAKRLYISERQAADILGTLSAQGLLDLKGKEDVQYRYQPTSQQLIVLLDELADAYSKHLVPVTNLIHTKEKPRIQQFADAFRLRKD